MSPTDGLCAECAPQRAMQVAGGRLSEGHVGVRFGRLDLPTNLYLGDEKLLDVMEAFITPYGEAVLIELQRDADGGIKVCGCGRALALTTRSVGLSDSPKVRAERCITPEEWAEHL